MKISRRNLLVASACCGALPGVARGEDYRTAERSSGNPSAPVTAIEYFSLTCTHCAAFSRETMPEVRSKLIEPGKLRMVYKDYPLDQVALTAAMVARALPPERYEPFISALFANQDRWAFARGVNSTEELWKMGSLAGMNRKTFDSTINDESLRAFVMQEREEGEKKYGVDSTPTFIVNGHKHAGEMDFKGFEQLVATT
ncbi:MAG: DsbA family protein [Acetobacteraceae bacterium]|nr:DsbA family protein [Acetobacteraceae bacterium]